MMFIYPVILWTTLALPFLGLLQIPQILEVGKGTIQPGTGMAEFIVRYRAIVYRPFRDETVDGIVKIVNKVRTRRGMRPAQTGSITRKQRRVPYLDLLSRSLTALRTTDGLLCRSWPLDSLCVEPCECSLSRRLLILHQSTASLIWHPVPPTTSTSHRTCGSTRMRTPHVLQTQKNSSR